MHFACHGITENAYKTIGIPLISGVIVRPRPSLEMIRNYNVSLLGQKEISHLPVVDPHDSTRLVGLITKGDIIKAYNQRRLVRRKLSWDQNGESL